MAVAGVVAIAVGLGIIFFFWRYPPGTAPDRERHLNEQLSEAIEQVVDGDEDQAFRVLSEAVKATDAPAAVYFALAALLRSRGQFDRSTHVLRTILVRSNLPAETTNKAKIALASDLTYLGRLDDANEVIESLPKKVRKDSNMLVLKQEAARRRGEWREAMGMSKTLARSRGEEEVGSADDIAGIAEEAAAKGDFDAAAKGFHQVLKEKPQSVRAHLGLAKLLTQQGKESKAKRHLVAAVEINPALAPKVLASVRDDLDDSQNADERFLEVLDDLETRPDLALWVGLERADEFYRRDLIEKCRETLEQLLELHPRSLEVHEAYLNLLIELDENKALQAHIPRFLDVAAEEIRRFHCGQCGYLSSKPFLDCPACAAVGSAVYTSY